MRCFIRNRCRGGFAEFAILALAALCAASCRTGAPPPAAPATPTATATPTGSWGTVTENEFCRVHSSKADAELAEELARTVMGVCREFKARGWPVLPRPVDLFLYKHWADFVAAAAGSGWMKPQYDGAANIGAGSLFMFHEWLPTVRLLEVARHETTHLLLHQAGGFRIPQNARQAFPQELLPAVPWWLEEGLASCLETGAAARGPGAGINPGRCRDLQELIRTERCPPLAEIIAKPLDTKGSGGDYAVAWGILYDVLFPPLPSSHGEGLRRLHAYLEACRRGFLADPEREFAARFLGPDGQPPPGFEAAWSAHISSRSVAEFGRLLPAGSSLGDWEDGWRQRMLQLRPAMATPPGSPSRR